MTMTAMLNRNSNSFSDVQINSAYASAWSFMPGRQPETKGTDKEYTARGMGRQ